MKMKNMMLQLQFDSVLGSLLMKLYYYPLFFPRTVVNICSRHLLIFFVLFVCFHSSDRFLYNVCVTECLQQGESCKLIYQPICS